MPPPTGPLIVSVDRSVRSNSNSQPATFYASKACIAMTCRFACAHFQPKMPRLLPAQLATAFEQTSPAMDVINILHIDDISPSAICFRAWWWLLILAGAELDIWLAWWLLMVRRFHNYTAAWGWTAFIILIGAIIRSCRHEWAPSACAHENSKSHARYQRSASDGLLSANVTPAIPVNSRKSRIIIAAKYICWSSTAS